MILRHRKISEKHVRNLQMMENMQWALYPEHMHSQSVSGTA